MNGPPLVRIFVGSPGDVALERSVAAGVVEVLRGEFRGRLRIEATFWEGLPLEPTAGYQEQIPDPATYDVCVFILWSRLGRPITRKGAAPTGTEHEFGRAMEGRRADPTKSVLLFRKTAPVQRDVSGAEEAARAALDDAIAVRRFFDGLTSKDGDELARHDVADAEEFRARLESSLRALLVRRFERAGTGIGAKDLPEWRGESPYRGLEVFDGRHAGVFFGRTANVERALALLKDQSARGRPALLVTGRSGVGKSSFVRAGLAPILTSPGVAEGVHRWSVVLWEPSDAVDGKLVLGLTHALLSSEVLAPLRASRDPESFARELTTSPESAAAAITATLAVAEHRDGLRSRVLLLIDPLEEIFTRKDVRDEDRRALARALRVVVRSGSVWALATVRGDFVDRCAELGDLMDLFEGAGQYYLPLPTRDQLVDIVKLPAIVAGLRFEESPGRGSLADVVLNEIENQSDLLPLLQFTLAEVFRASDAERDGTLKFSSYDGLGGLAGSLTNRTLEATAKLRARLGARFDDALDALFDALVGATVGDGDKTARRYATKASLDADPAISAAVEILSSERLLVTDKDDRGRAVVTFCHEALFRRWRELEEWIARNVESLRVRARVRAAAERWEEDGRGDDLLLHAGKPLAEAVALLKERRRSLEPLDLEFVRRSVEVDGGLKTRSLKLRRRVTTALAALCVASFVLLGVAVAHSRAADDAARAAEKARGEEAAQRGVAVERARRTLTLLKYLLRDLAGSLDPANARDAVLIDQITEKTTASYLDVDVGRDPPADRVVFADNMASAAQSLGALEKREEQLRLGLRALEILESSACEDAETMARCELLVTEAARYRSRTALADATLERVRKRVERGGLSDEAVVDYYLNRGGLDRSLFRLDAALEHLLRAHAEAERRFGRKSWYVAKALNDVANAHRTRKEPSEAKDFYLKAIELVKGLGGERHRELAHNYAGLGVVESELGNAAAAEDYLARAVAIEEHQWGPIHRWVGADLTKYARVLAAHGKLAEARKAIDRAVEILRRDQVSRSFLATALDARAAVHARNGATEDRLVDLRECYLLRSADTLLGATHPLTREACANYVAALEAAGRRQEASEIRRQAEAESRKS